MVAAMYLHGISAIVSVSRLLRIEWADRWILSGVGLGSLSRPDPADVIFQLFLPGLHPGRVMPLGDLDGRVCEKDRDVRELDALEQQRHGERVAETVRMPTNDGRVGDGEQFPEDAIPA